MAKYNISGNPNIGSMGDGARAKNFSQNTVLGQELAALAETLNERAQTSDQIATAKHVTEAGKAEQNGDQRTVVNKLKAAGAWAFDVATEIGKEVAAKAISSQLGLGP